MFAFPMADVKKPLNSGEVEGSGDTQGSDTNR
jgi:hypothetical protein